MEHRHRREPPPAPNRILGVVGGGWLRSEGVSKLCRHPGCSEPGAAAYGMIPEDLLFWIAPLHEVQGTDAAVLCRRHADAMVVPRGWTLDDRREPTPRLFKPHPANQERQEPRPAPASRRRQRQVEGEQLQIDGTGEIARPTPSPEPEPVPEAEPESAPAWDPGFADDDLDGLLESSSPLLARAFRGLDRPRR